MILPLLSGNTAISIRHHRIVKYILTTHMHKIFKQNPGYKPFLLKLGFITLVSLPVIIYVFKISILNRHGIFQGEDWDYFAQNYEAARQSILQYHQFPWWNPWMNGGQPLFANPQFGLISIQMPLVLLFGTVAGLHYSLLFYFLLGFWGMYLLLGRSGSKSRLISILLSYIWVFSGFNAAHLSGGHLTFAIYLLVPWVLLTLLNINRSKLGWLWFGLSLSVLLNSGAHYLTFESLFIVLFISAFQIVRIWRKDKIKNLKAGLPSILPYIYAAVLVALLCSIKLYYTIQFVHEYPRMLALDPPESLKLFLASITFRHGVDPATLTNFGAQKYGWGEFGNYFGLSTLALFIYLVIKKFKSVKSIRPREWFLLTGILLAALITIGNFWSLSPF